MKKYLPLLILAGCATPTAPPLPPGFVASSKQSSAIPLPPPENTTSIGYGSIHWIDQQDHSYGTYLQWNNWPIDRPYLWQQSNDLTNWKTLYTIEAGDDGRMLRMFVFPERQEFYRIIDAPLNFPPPPPPSNTTDTNLLKVLPPPLPNGRDETYQEYLKKMRE